MFGLAGLQMTSLHKHESWLQKTRAQVFSHSILAHEEIICNVIQTLYAYVATVLRAGPFRVRIPARAREFSPLQNAQTGSRNHPTSYWISAGDFFLWQSGRNVRITTHNHPVLRWVWVGLYLHFSSYAFMAWTRKTLTFFFLPFNTRQIPIQHLDHTTTDSFQILLYS